MSLTPALRLRRVAAALLASSAAIVAYPGLASALTISPLPGTPDASPRTQISFLGAARREISDVSVVGSLSGNHSGGLRSYVSATGASFVPEHEFAQGESVHVAATITAGGKRRRVGTTFTVARIANLGTLPGRAVHPPKPGQVQSFASAPSLRPPRVYVTTKSAAATDADILLTSASKYGQAGGMILDPSGGLLWFQPAATGNAIENLQVQSYEGKPVLTYWQGHIDLGVGFGTDSILDSSYRRVASVRAGNGYYADLHEMQLTPGGSAFITAYTIVRTSLASVGGPADGELEDAVVQQIDVKTGLVMFEWHAFGHVALLNSYARVPHTVRPWDFFHMNSISLDPWGDGNFLVSSRNTWAAYEVDKSDGAVLWRIGGRRPTFRMGAGTGTAYQHDARWQADGTITIFDNGAVPKAHSTSRAIRERIDFKGRSVKLIDRFEHSPRLLSGSQGNSQRLGSGNTFVGWGEDPYFTEYSPTGEVLLDGHLSSSSQAYRSFRAAWSGAPSTSPSVAVKAANASSTTVYASWNGATDVASWTVLAGSSTNALVPLTTALRAGFETTISVNSSAKYFAVQANGADGGKLAVSRALAR